MNFWIEALKFALPLLLENKSALTILCLTCLLIVALPAGIVAYNDSINTNRLIEAQRAGNDKIALKQDETTEAILRLANVVEGQNTVAVNLKPSY